MRLPHYQIQGNCNLFGGIGTTDLVAGALKRKFISYESNPKKCKTANVLMGVLITKWKTEILRSNQPIAELLSQMDISILA